MNPTAPKASLDTVEYIFYVPRLVCYRCQGAPDCRESSELLRPSCSVPGCTALKTKALLESKNQRHERQICVLFRKLDGRLRILPTHAHGAASAGLIV